MGNNLIKLACKYVVISFKSKQFYEVYFATLGLSRVKTAIFDKLPVLAVLVENPLYRVHLHIRQEGSRKLEILFETSAMLTFQNG